LSDLALDLLLGEPGPHEHLESCASCRARFDALAVEQQRFDAAKIPLMLRPRRRLGATIGFAAALAAGLAALVLRPPMEDVTRAKGRPVAIGFFVKHKERVRRAGSSTEAVAPGDALRFWYTSSKPTHLAILSIDPAGKTSTYYPASAKDTEATGAGREVALPISTVLDDTLGRERIYGFFCDAPVALDRLALALGGAAPEGCTEVELGFDKRREP
jgi:hypothetical protein